METLTPRDVTNAQTQNTGIQVQHIGPTDPSCLSFPEQKLDKIGRDCIRLFHF